MASPSAHITLDVDAEPAPSPATAVAPPAVLLPLDAASSLQHSPHSARLPLHAIYASFWETLKRAPWAFSDSSFVLSFDATVYMLSRLLRGLTPLHTDKLLAIQLVERAILADLLDNSSSSSFTAPAVSSAPQSAISLQAWKRTSLHRYLFVGSQDGLLVKDPAGNLRGCISTTSDPAEQTAALCLLHVLGVRSFCIAGEGDGQGWPVEATLQERGVAADKLLPLLDACGLWLRDSCLRQHLSSAPPAADPSQPLSATFHLSISALSRSERLLSLSSLLSAAAGAAPPTAHILPPLLVRSNYAGAAAPRSPAGLPPAAPPIPFSVSSAGAVGAANAGVGASAASSAPDSFLGKVSGSKRGREEDAAIPRPLPAAPSAGAASSSSSGVSLAIIVPFRDQPEQNRGEQLRRFSAYMQTFLPRVIPPLVAYHVFIIEQSQDSFKFNRGKCLNAGYAIATRQDMLQRAGITATPLSAAPAFFNAFCFHDVDLLPQDPLLTWYGRPPVPSPIHIGAAWTKYLYPDYVGGIITMSGTYFQQMNGFPNNFWGWGGEDDEINRRMKAKQLPPPEKPDTSCTGAIVDMEDILIKERGGERAGTSIKMGGRSEWRSMWKSELLRYHQETQHKDGLNSLDYTLLGMRKINPVVTVFTVDLHAREDPAAEKQEHFKPTLVCTEETKQVYVRNLLQAYESKRKGMAAGGGFAAGGAAGGGGGVGGAAAAGGAGTDFSNAAAQATLAMVQQKK